MILRFTIYCHTNRVNGKRYVGQTVYSMEKRWGDHVAAAKRGEWGSRVFNRAIRKHGVDAFDHQVLEVVSTQEEADLYEILWIEQLTCRVPHGYNLQSGGGGQGLLHADTKRLIGKASRARWEKIPTKERSKLPPAEGLRTWWRDMTAEEYNVAIRRRSDRFLAWWQEMTAEERSIQQRARQKNVSPERRSATAVKSWETRRVKYGQDGVKRVRSPEEHGESIKLGWASMTPEARAERVRKIKEGVLRAREEKKLRLVRVNLLRAA